MNAYASVGGGSVSPIRHLAGLYETVGEGNCRIIEAEPEGWQLRDQKANQLMHSVDMALLHSRPYSLTDLATLLVKLGDYTEVIRDTFDEVDAAAKMTRITGDAISAAIHNASTFIIDLVASRPERATSEPKWTATVDAWTRAKRAFDASDPAATTSEQTDAVFELQDAVFGVPAPDLGAIIYKIEQARERYDGFEMPDHIFDVVLKDLRRLSGISEPDYSQWAAATAAYWEASHAHEAVSDDEAFEPEALKAVDAALAILLATPAPDAAALAEKAEIIEREGAQSDEDAFQQLLNDARRIGLR